MALEASWRHSETTSVPTASGKSGGGTLRIFYEGRPARLKLKKVVMPGLGGLRMLGKVKAKLRAK